MAATTGQATSMLEIGIAVPVKVDFSKPVMYTLVGGFGVLSGCVLLAFVLRK